MRTNRRQIAAGLILVALVVALAGSSYLFTRAVGTTLVSLYADVEAARAALGGAVALARTAGPELETTDAATLITRLEDADAALARSQSTLEHDPFIVAMRGVPVLGTQFAAASDLIRAGRTVASRREVIAGQLQDYIAARDSGTGVDRLAELARFVYRDRSATNELLAAFDEAAVVVDGIQAAGLVGPLEDVRSWVKRELDVARPIIEGARTASDVLPAIMGVGGERRYLVLALDNAEIRPIGGLIGAFATPRFVDGKLEDLTFRDILSIDRQDQAVYVQPPDPLADHLLDDFTWQVADAGWWPDFGASVAEVRRMYRIETGEDDFQGVVAFTPEFVDRLLQVVGPVEVPSAGITVHPGETYLLSLEQVEVLNHGEGRKQFLADLARVVLDRVFALPPSEYGRLVAAINEAGMRRNLQVLLDDPRDQAALDALDWPDPFTFAPTGDRLAVMETNVAPISKLNVLLTMEHGLDVQLNADGSATERLVTTYTNHYGLDLPPALERVRSSFFEGNLGTYSRRYLVPDAILVGVSSDDPADPITDPESVEQESGGLAVGNYQFIPPGTVRLTTDYVAPNVVVRETGDGGGTYRLDFRKQAGRDADLLKVRVTVPSGTQPTSWSVGGVRDGASVMFATTTEFDRTFDVTFRQVASSTP